MAAAVYHNDVSNYTCALRAQKEHEVLFRTQPLLIGLSCEIPASGDYLTDDFSGVPILLVRSETGALNAFVNVCSHRGARLAQDRGCDKKRITCPYHAWSYAQSGELLSIPFESGFFEIDKSDHGLRSLPVVEKHGLIWVVPTPAAEIDIDRHLDILSDDLKSYGLTDYHHYETRTLRIDMNWKLVVDTFLETYHLDVLHRKTIAPILHGNTATFDPMGQNLRMIGARRSIASLKDEPEENWDLIKHSAVVYVLFPNTVFIMQGDHLETWRVYPDGGADKAKMHVSLYTPVEASTESAKRYWDKNMELLMSTVLKEDFPLGVNIQKDFRSGIQDSVLYGHNEPALAHFHHTIGKALDQP